MLNRFIRALGVLSFIGVSSAALAADKEIQIGFMPPLTGPDVGEGLFQKRAAELAVKQLNAAGGINGAKVKLVIEDNKSSNEGAFAAFEKLLSNNAINAVIGPIKSAQVVAILPKIVKAEMPTLTGGTNPRLTADGGGWVLRIRPDDSIAAAAMVRYLKEEAKITKISIIHDSQAFGSGGANLVEKNARELGGMSVVKRFSYQPGETKAFKGMIEEAKKAGAEALIVYTASTTEAGLIQAAFKEAGRPFIYMGSPSSATRGALEIAKDAADGNFHIADVILGQSDTSRKFVEEYRKEYNDDPDTIHSYTYDAVHILAEAIKKSDGTRAGIRKAMLGIKNHKGYLGSFNFDSIGNGLQEVSVAKIQGGKPQLAKVVQGSSVK